MKRSEFVAIRHHLQRAMEDIDYFLNGLEARKKTESELCELYELMEAGKTPPEVAGCGKPVQLTREQYAAIDWRTADGEPITDEQREAILADVLPGQPISDEGWAALQFALRGGWQESSRQAGIWLQKARRTIEASAIDVELSLLSRESRGEGEVRENRNAWRVAAERVREILACIIAESGDTLGTAGNPNKRSLPAPDQTTNNAGETPTDKPGEGKGPESPGSNAEESVDVAGNVTNPRDPTAYFPANETRLKHGHAALAVTHKQFMAILRQHPEIKRWHPRKNRLLVHLADWLAFVKSQTEQLGSDGLLADQMEIEARIAGLRRRKSHAK